LASGAGAAGEAVARVASRLTSIVVFRFEVETILRFDDLEGVCFFAIAYLSKSDRQDSTEPRFNSDPQNKKSAETLR